MIGFLLFFFSFFFSIFIFGRGQRKECLKGMKALLVRKQTFLVHVTTDAVLPFPSLPSPCPDQIRCHWSPHFKDTA